LKKTEKETIKEDRERAMTVFSVTSVVFLKTLSWQTKVEVSSRILTLELTFLTVTGLKLQELSISRLFVIFQWKFC